MYHVLKFAGGLPKPGCSLCLACPRTQQLSMPHAQVLDMEEWKHGGSSDGEDDDGPPPPSDLYAYYMAQVPATGSSLVLPAQKMCTPVVLACREQAVNSDLNLSVLLW